MLQLPKFFLLYIFILNIKNLYIFNNTVELLMKIRIQCSLITIII
jgi:hypothetical protein